MDDRKTVNGKNYEIIRLLGHGKGGYSYLAEMDGRQVVLKQIHHEPCDYYTFGNKIEAERNDYGRLCRAGIRIPELIDIDTEAERVVKEYIEGPTVADLVKAGISAAPYMGQAREMAARAKAAGLNIDYYPTNFVVRDGLLWYIDYECNEYMDEWNFENWGRQYWTGDREGNAVAAGLSHVAIRTRDIEESVRYYTQVLGFSEAFRMHREDGSTATVYIMIMPGQYIELFDRGTREGAEGDDVTGLRHLCLMTTDIERSRRELLSRGGPADSEIYRGKSQCLMFWTHDPDGTRIEIMEMVSGSMQAKADIRYYGEALRK